MFAEHWRPVWLEEGRGGGGEGESRSTPSILYLCLLRRFPFVYLHLLLVVLTTRNIHPSIPTNYLTFNANSNVSSFATFAHKLQTFDRLISFQ